MKQKGIVLAFNKSVQEEMARRIGREERGKKWTPEQERFIKLAGERNTLGEAVAGSGKTTTMLEAISRMKDISFSTSTLHSIGFRAWRMKHPGIKINAKKSWGIYNDLGFFFKPPIATGVIQLVSIAKNWGILGEEPELEELIEHFGIELPEYGVSAAKRILYESIKRGKKEIDFDDMLLLPVMFGGKWEKFSVVMVDEVQDLSLLQQEILEKILKKPGRIVAVGDRRQAIYGFRGADAESVERLEERFGLERAPLTVSWRCGKEIIAEAQKIVPEIQAAPDAHAGAVHLVEHGISPFSLPDAVICRSNAPLMRLAFACLRESIPFTLLGKDLFPRIRAILATFGESTNTPIRSFRKLLWDDFRAKPQNRQRVLEDIYEAISAILDFSPELANAGKTIEKSLRTLESSKGKTILSTIHKAKGMEWKRVGILGPEIIPSKFARTPWELQQEENLKYVAITRAIEELTYFPIIKDRGF